MPADFAKREEEILKFWEENGIFEKTLAKKSPRGNFVFFEGPPTANGKPGIHHVASRAFKDLIPRYKTMRGYHVERKAGWDTHGLPVELEVEKQLGISGKRDIERLKDTPEASIAFFNEQCRKSVWKYLDEWNRLTKRVAFWLDLDRPYVTYETPYVESLWWAIKEIWKQGLLYEDDRIVPYCPRCGTTLSSHEVAQGYKEVEDPSIYIRFAVAGEPKTYFLVWTTTPWTLPANVALAVNPEVSYVKIRRGEETLILAEERAAVAGAGDVIATVSGKDLVGMKYEPLYSFLPAPDAHRVVAADFVSTADGTGIVHIAPAFGEEDLRVGRENDLPVLKTVDEEGKFISAVAPWAGVFVKDADQQIVDELDRRGLLFKAERHAHDYPFCWRCSTPLLYYAKRSWWIRVTEVHKKLLKNAGAIRWVPAHIKEGRFGEWLRGVKDWAFSRERYWGTPLPVWRCGSCENIEVVGSIAELNEKKIGADMLAADADLHRPMIDRVKLACGKCKGEMSRVKEVIDVWFDSGAMPFAQWHYPFENKAKVDKGEAFPADYISEAIDQTRGWFYTLLAVSTLLGRGAPYKNVVSLGHVLDAKGQKMSKSKGNVVDPWLMIERYGADAVRWYMYTVNHPGDPKRFDEADLDRVTKQFFLILQNVAVFWKTYASEASPESASGGKLHASRFTLHATHVLDRWILARGNELIKIVTTNLEEYEATDAARPIGEFVTDLSTWYVRRSRERFKGDDAEDRAAAGKTLRHTLTTLARLLAPFTPFFAEELYRAMGEGGESVHLADWPEVEKRAIDEDLLKEMTVVRTLASMALEKRAAASIPVRQALLKLTVKTREKLSPELLALLRDEVNVREVVGEEREGSPDVSLDTTITPELRREGLAREVARQVNALRKLAGLTIADKIVLAYETESAELREMFSVLGDTLRRDTRAAELREGKLETEFSKTMELDGAKVVIRLTKL
jgi:isoleucyl-tRNA synthetase